MSNSARSVLVFGIYLAVLGLVLLTVPNFLLVVFTLPSTNEVWIRVVGMLVLFLGFYYSQAARKEMTDFAVGRCMSAPQSFSFSLSSCY